MSNGTLLAVLAHPDDESFGLGGTLALYAHKGCEVNLVCATRGEAGTADEEHLRGFDSIADLRESELRCAAGILGLKGVYFLDYRDSGMPGSADNQHPDAQINHPVEEVAEQVVKYIRQLRPDILLTFDPIGGYRHPDHIHIHQATVMAFEKASDPSFHPESGEPFSPRALYFHTFPRWFLRLATTLLRLSGKDPHKWGKNGDIDLQSIAEVRFPTHVRINIREVIKEKEAAGACHISQGGRQMRRGVIGWFTRLMGEHEDYMRAYPPFGERERVSRDLFTLPNIDK